jgi:soluble lytic murein transglycosylase-like protein
VNWRASLLAFPALMLASATAKAGGWECWAQASQKYGVPVNLLYSIARVETGVRNGVIHRNENGTYDIGLMQINSSHLPFLKKYGITEASLQSDACLNLKVGAWILAMSIRDHGMNWRGVGAYNAGSDQLRANYARKVVRELKRVEQNGYAGASQ